jgi:diguanylate cyclase (GGDEF)-like protein
LQVLSREQIQTIFRGIRDAFDEHVRWSCRCQHALISEDTSDLEILESSAHRLCKFGQWYHGPQPRELRRSEEFMRLGELHRRFHDAVHETLSVKRSGSRVTPEISERLVTAQSDLLLCLNQYLCDVATGDQFFDPLTGVLNRKDMFRLLRREQNRMERMGQPCALALADLDHFKLVNDQYGHDVGDVVLREAAARFTQGLRSYDLLFRYGGEEFLFCLPDTDIAEAFRISERTRENLAQTAIEVNGVHRISITVSFGLSALSPGVSVEDSVRAADRALYQAKESGRNRVYTLAPLSH